MRALGAFSTITWKIFKISVKILCLKKKKLITFHQNFEFKKRKLMNFHRNPQNQRETFTTTLQFSHQNISQVKKQSMTHASN